MVARLQDLGIELDRERIQNIVDSVDSPGRPHLARLLVEYGVVADTQEAFDRFLGEGKPAYVKRERIELKAGIELLSSVGAVPVLAHPLLINVDHLDRLIVELIEVGLKGIEVRYAYPDPALQDRIVELSRLAKELGLIETGGSDYHEPSSHAPLGGVTVPVETIELLRDAARL